MTTIHCDNCKKHIASGESPQANIASCTISGDRRDFYAHGHLCIFCTTEILKEFKNIALKFSLQQQQFDRNFNAVPEVSFVTGEAIAPPGQAWTNKNS